MNELCNRTMEAIGSYLPNLLGALAILVIGWIVAMVIAALIRAVLHRTTLDNKIARLILGTEKADRVPVENTVARGVFYLLMVFVLVGFFQALQLTMVSEPLNNMLARVFEFLPRVLGAGILLLLAWLLATILRRIMLGIMQRARLDDRLGEAVTTEPGKAPPLSKTMADVVYWLVLLLFLPAVLDALGLEGPLEPVQAMMNQVSGFLPNVIGAVVIVLIGWFVAFLVRRVVTSLLAAAGVDRLLDRLGMSTSLGEMKLSGLIGLVVYIFILIPVVIMGLDALKLEAITQPASQMLGTFLAAIPNIFGAVLLLVIAIVVARLVAGLVTNLLQGVGFDQFPQKLGLSATAAGSWKPSALVGTLVLAAIVLLATIEAAGLLEFTMLADLLKRFLEFAGHVLLGVVIFALGLLLANLVGKSLQESSATNSSRWVPILARVAILLLAGAMALSQMGIADNIVNLAFGLLLGAVAIAIALAFGLGGRESAARLIEQWRNTNPPK
ncbi:mechanosensitive ion channel [bacterium]|nr:mechanosensitive ion channel [bacterium]